MLIKKNNYIFTYGVIILSIIIIANLTIACASIPEELLPKEDDDAKTLLEKGRNLFSAEFPEKAIEVFDLIINNENFKKEEKIIIAWAYYEKAFILFQEKSYEDALFNFEVVYYEYKTENPAASILAYKFIRRINYAKEIDDMSILIHNSSYAIPEDYTPPIPERYKTENDEDEDEDEDEDNNNNSEDEEDDEDEDEDNNSEDEEDNNS